jgi:hypothetical protein
MAEINMPNSGRKMDDSELEPIVTGSKRTKKKGWQRWKDVFIAVNREEFEASFTTNLLYPACRELVVRLAHGAVDILFNGAGNPNAYYGGGNERTPYYRVSSAGLPLPASQQPVGKTAAGYSLDDVGFTTYDKAMSVLNKLNSAIAEFGVVDVYAFYIWADSKPDYTDKAWGWEEPINCKPLLRRDGMYFLPLPKPKRIAQR